MTKTTRISYDEQAPDYDLRWKSYLEHTHREFLLRVLINENDKVLDASCGTGLLARSLIERKAPFKKLVLNDLSEGMLSIARRRTDHPDIVYTQHSADQLDALEDTFDLILSLNSFHYYENPDKTVRTFQRLLKTGGRLCILDWNRVGLFRPLNFILRHTTKEKLFTRSHFEMTEMLEEAEFTIRTLDTWAYRYWRLFFIEAIRN